MQWSRWPAFGSATGAYLAALALMPEGRGPAAVTIEAMVASAQDHPVAPPAEGFPVGPPDVVRGGPQLIPRPPTWRPGATAPWAELPEAVRRPDLGRIRAALATAPPPRASAADADPARQASAVLAALYPHEGEPHVLLTRRSWDLRAHRGEVSFPGGRREPHDSDLAETALREAFEEVGIEPSAVEVIAELDHLATVSSMSFIVPFVGVLPSRPEVRPDPREVSEVLHVPVTTLLAAGTYREEIWSREGSERPIWFFELVGDTVWGATAAILRQLLCVVTEVDPGPARHP